MVPRNASRHQKAVLAMSIRCRGAPRQRKVVLATYILRHSRGDLHLRMVFCGGAGFFASPEGDFGNVDMVPWLSFLRQRKAIPAIPTQHHGASRRQKAILEVSVQCCGWLRHRRAIFTMLYGTREGLVPRRLNPMTPIHDAT